MRRPSESDYRVVLGELRELRQLVLALAPRPTAIGKTFGELAQDWLRRIAPRRADGAGNERRHVRHMKALASLREGELTKGAIDDALGALAKPKGPLGPATLNKLRGTGKLIVLDAQGNNEWRGLNPFELISRQDEGEPVYATLELHEVGPVLRFINQRHHAIAKTVLLVGIRPGEAFALEKCDVDLVRKKLVIRRSHGRGRTKTGKERTFPIPDSLLADLVEAIALSPSSLVFPKPDGSRRSPNSRLTDRLRTAMKRAGVAVGWRFRCRKFSCPYDAELRRDTRELVPCPRCEEPMWSVAIPKPLRFYDLRHSSSTLHIEAGAAPIVVQQMLGHAPTNTMDAKYIHVTDAFRRSELNKLEL